MLSTALHFKQACLVYLFIWEKAVQIYIHTCWCLELSLEPCWEGMCAGIKDSSSAVVDERVIVTVSLSPIKFQMPTGGIKPLAFWSAVCLKRWRRSKKNESSRALFEVIAQPFVETPDTLNHMRPTHPWTGNSSTSWIQYEHYKRQTSVCIRLQRGSTNRDSSRGWISFHKVDTNGEQRI